MNTIFGVKVVVSQMVDDTPKLKFSWPEPTPLMHEFNRWLLQRFGSNPTFFRTTDSIITNRRGYELLKRAAAEQKP